MQVRTVNAIVVLCAAFLLFIPLSVTAQLSISNETLRVDVDVTAAQFNITHLPSQRLFVNGGQFTFTGGVGSTGTTTNSIFGVGQIIDIVYPNGNRDDVMLFSNLPFAIFQTTLSNGTPQTVISNSIQTLTLPEDLQELTSLLKIRGTSGLSSGISSASSSEWLAIADPTNRFGIVNGWLTDDGATGMVNCQNQDFFVQVNPFMQYGRLPIAPGQSVPLEMFAVGYFDDARVGLETWADTVAKIYNIHLPPQPVGFSTYPAAPHNGPCDETNLPIVTDFIATNLESFGYSIVQIDGRWEAGVSTNGNSPPRDFSTNNPTPYLHGMKPMADYITSRGLTPGIWFEPFSGTVYDPAFSNHLDWFVYATNGTPFFTGNFGGWALDMTYPPTRTYISNIVHQLAYDWGYRYFKMDAFAAGLAVPVSGQSTHTFSDAIYSDTNKTPIQIFRDGIKLLHQAAGTNVFFLGCNIPQNMRSYGASFGLVDAMRIGSDVAANWSGMINTGVKAGSTHYFLNGRIWYDDPDTVYARTNLLFNQAQAYCSWVGFVGELTIDGDWLPDQTPDRIEILKRIAPSHGLFAHPVDYFENTLPGLWLLTDTRRLVRRDVIGVFNWSSDETLNVPLSHIGLPLTNYVGFDFWNNSLIPSISNSLQITVPADSCSIIAVRPVSNRPQLLSTSRHITQGMVDVLSESWSDTPKSLNGQSLVVGGDHYELRVVVPTNTWQAISATVSDADQSAGVTATFSQSGNLVRAMIQSPMNRQVSWTIGFSGPTNLPPRLNHFSLADQNLQISGTNGIWNAPYLLLASTNLSLPLNNWTVVSTNYFDANGNFNLTNPMTAGVGQTFYRLMLP